MGSYLESRDHRITTHLVYWLAAFWRATPLRYNARMRLSIRYQLLLPLLTLLLGVLGISTWTALASANRARQQIDAQVNDIIATVQQPPAFPLTDRVMLLMK